MKHINISRHRGFFEPVTQSSAVQAAVMVLEPGQSSSDQPETEHPKAEQWCLVISGTGRAKGGGRSIPIRAGSLILVEKREKHQIVNSGKQPLVTLNFYAPPAYTAAGEVKPKVKN